QESCAYADDTVMLPSRRRGPRYTYWFVFGSSAIWPLMLVTRPVSSPYCVRASLTLVVDPPETEVAPFVKMPNAGSQLPVPHVAEDTPRLTVGTTVCAFSHAPECRYPPPKLKL